MFNWNDLHSFITLSRCSKLIIASKKLRIEPTTIARRINRLEKSLNTDLFFKSHNGYSLTEMGHCLLKYVERELLYFKHPFEILLIYMYLLTTQKFVLNPALKTSLFNIKPPHQRSSKASLISVPKHAYNF